MITGMKNYLISNKTDFKKFKIKYSKNDIKIIKRFNINKKDYFDYYGNIKNIKGITKYLSSIGNNSQEDIQYIKKLNKQFMLKILIGF